MTEAIADADIISTFGKVGRLDLLQRLFDRLYVTPAVYRELLRAEEVGFSWVSAVKQIVEVIPLTESQSHEVANLFAACPQLGSGEVETFILARGRRLPCLTNDRQPKRSGKLLVSSALTSRKSCGPYGSGTCWNLRRLAGSSRRSRRKIALGSKPRTSSSGVERNLL